MTQLVISAVGPDRPGIVGELTGLLHAEGANLLDLRMVNLRGEFAMMILLECDEQAAARISEQLPAQGERMGLKVLVAQQPLAAMRAEGLRYRLKTYSLDQPGIVARITQVLREHGVNIEELSARQESAPFDGSPLFLTEMRLTVPASADVGRLRGDLAAVGKQLNCDVDLDATEG